MTPEQRMEKLERMARAREAELDLDRVAPVLDMRREQVIQQVFQKLREGPLDPQMAVQAWLSMYEITQLERSLRSEIRQGRKAGEKLIAAEESEANSADLNRFPYT